MSFKGYGKQKSEVNDLTILHKNILQIAIDLRKNHHIYDTLTLFKTCCKKLPNPAPEIDRAIRELHRMKYLIEGKMLTKEDILSHEKRSQIYEFIKENPGVHQREIRDAFELGAYSAFRHLNLLANFGFLKKRPYKNKVVYFPSNFDPAHEEQAVLLRNQTPRVIYECITEYGKIRPAKLEKLLEIPYSTIQFNLNALMDVNLITPLEEDSTTYYVPATPKVLEKTVEIKREYDYVGGNIRFKVAVRNPTDMAILNITVLIKPSDQFTVDVPQQQIPNLPAQTSRGVDFMLTPLSCGTSRVFGSVTYEDAYGTVKSIPIQPKEISIKCPLVKPQIATQSEVNTWISNLKLGSSTINFRAIQAAQAFQIGRDQVSALDLTEVRTNQEELWSLYSGEVKVTGNKMVVKLSVDHQSLTLDVWADDLKQTTGFLAYLSNLINLALESSYKMVRKTENITQKIVNLLKTCAVIDHTISLCATNGNVSTICENLMTMSDLTTQAACESHLIESIKAVRADLTDNSKSLSEITDPSALDLRYKALYWLKKINEIISHHRTTYQEVFDDIANVSEQLNLGIDMLDEKINEHEKAYSLSILSYLMILDKASGITLFERNLGELSINPDLVGGFLHALQSFGREISSADRSMRTLSYEDFQFQIETGHFTRTALILRGTPTDFITSRLKAFVTQFEQNFEGNIKHFTGNVDEFSPANALFNAIFK